MVATYPYTQKDRLVGAKLNLELELSPGTVPPTSAHSHARIYKQWIDTSVTPAALRMCMVPIASAGYVAAEWTTIATIDTTAKKLTLLADVAGYLKLSGGTLTGPLILAANPTAALGAATKQYVDGLVGAYLPLTGGTLTGLLNGTAFNTGAGGFSINGTSAVSRDATYTYVWDQSGGAALELGGAGTPQSNYSNTIHYFFGRGTSVLFARIDGSGVDTNFGFQIKGVQFAFGDASYNYVYDASSRAALYLGSASVAQNVYANTVHQFENSGASVSFATIDATGINTQTNFKILGRLFANADTNFTYVYNPSGTTELQLGAGQSIITSTQHNFYGAGNTPLYVTFDSRGVVVTTGDGYKPGGGVWLDSSDRRIKQNITDYTAGLEAVCQLRPVSFEHNGLGGTTKNGRRYIGLIADDAEQVMPEMVGSLPALLNPDDTEKTNLKTLDATALIYALVNAVHELADGFQALTARVVALEGG